MTRLLSEGLPPGEHGVRIHGTANCRSDDGFAASGAPWTVQPNAIGTIVVGLDGKGAADLRIVSATLQPSATSMMAAPGTSIVIDRGADDAKPAARIACGVVNWIPINMQPEEKPD